MRLDQAAAAERAMRQSELAVDPDQGGRVSAGSL